MSSCFRETWVSFGTDVCGNTARIMIFLSLTLCLLYESFGTWTLSFSLCGSLSCDPVLLPRHSPKIRQLVFIMMKSKHCFEWKSYSMSHVLPVLIVFTFCFCFFFQNLRGAGRLEARNCQNRILGEITFIFILFSSVKMLYWLGNKWAGSLPGQCLCCSGTEDWEYFMLQSCQADTFHH